MTGRRLAVLDLRAGEEAALRSLANRRTTAQALALRARIVLACAEGEANQVVAVKLGVTPQTVGKWRARFVARRLDGLHDVYPFRSNLTCCDGGVSSPSVDIEYRSEETTR